MGRCLHCSDVRIPATINWERATAEGLHVSISAAAAARPSCCTCHVSSENISNSSRILHLKAQLCRLSEAVKQYDTA